MRILIATVQIPFVWGGAEIHAAGLRDAFRAAGHSAEIATLPWRGFPGKALLNTLLACRLWDVSSYMGLPVDLVIGLKFPAYLVRHSNKVLWILHQHRMSYELWDDPLAADLIHEPDGLGMRDLIRNADRRLIPEARAVFSNSGFVSQRLKRFCELDSRPLYHPPAAANEYYDGVPGDYLFFPSRINLMKRQCLILEALAKTRSPVRVHFAGHPDSPCYLEEMRALAGKLGVAGRVCWLGYLSEEEKRRQFAHARAVIYPPREEDYGYVTLEAMLARKAVLTCTDSGGPLEFVRDEESGLVAEPNAEAVARALDRAWSRADEMRSFGARGYDLYQEKGISWERVVATLLAAGDPACAS